MTRLIDVDRLISDFSCTFYNDLDDQNRTENLINEAPTVELTDLQDAYDQGYAEGWKERFGEPGERPQGEWVDIVTNTGMYKIKCSVCQYEENLYKTHIRNFCPNCGSDNRKQNVNCSQCVHYGKLECMDCERGNLIENRGDEK